MSLHSNGRAILLELLRMLEGHLLYLVNFCNFDEDSGTNIETSLV